MPWKRTCPGVSVVWPGILLGLSLWSTPLAAQTGTWRDTFENPFAYCAAVNTADRPGDRYVGPPMTPAIARGLQEAFGIDAEDIPQSLLLNSVWRCMDGEVYACNRGANLPCETRAEFDRQPTPALAAYCDAHPDAETVPLAVAGRATVYPWRCEDGEALAGEPFMEADQQGFLQSIWFRIPPP